MDLKLKNAIVLETGGSRGRGRRHLRHRPLVGAITGQAMAVDGGIGLSVQY